MPDFKELEGIVERVVSEVIASKLPELRREMVRRVLLELPSQVTAAARESASAAMLESAVNAIQATANQSDILTALLEFGWRFSARVALFVVRGNAASVWQARGFHDNDGLRNYNLDLTRGVAAKAVNERVAVPAGLDFDPGFVQKIGHAAAGNAALLPLVVREKAAALLYADVGLEGNAKLDMHALQLLTRTSGLWLEVLALRKGAGGQAAGGDRILVEPAAITAERPLAAAHAAVAQPATPAADMAPAAAPAQRSPSPAAAQSATAVAVAAPAVAVASASDESSWSEEEREVHARAQRFARLLVDEIKLYNPSKVAEGRLHKDLYDRLKDDIEKSRASYDRRYGTTAAGSADYFARELVRILADNDSSTLGSNFPG